MRRAAIRVAAAGGPARRPLALRPPGGRCEENCVRKAWLRCRQHARAAWKIDFAAEIASPGLCRLPRVPQWPRLADRQSRNLTRSVRGSHVTWGCCAFWKRRSSSAGLGA